MASTYLDLRAITCCEAARSGDDRQARYCSLQLLALARRAIIWISFPPIPWPMTLSRTPHRTCAVLLLSVHCCIEFLNCGLLKKPMHHFLSFFCARPFVAPDKGTNHGTTKHNQTVCMDHGKPHHHEVRAPLACM